MISVQPNPQVEDIKPFYRFESIEIKTQADCENAALGLKEIATRLKQAAAWHKEVVGPIKAGIKAFEQRLHQVTDPLESIQASVKRKLEMFWDSQRVLKEAEEAKKRAAEIEAAKQIAHENLELAAATGSATAIEAAQNFSKRAEMLKEAPLDLSQTIRTTGATVAQSTVWQWSVVDETQIPRQYFKLDESALNQAAKSYGKTPVTIPGIEFKQVSRAIVR